MENLSTGQRCVDTQYYFAEGRKTPEINLSGTRLKQKSFLMAGAVICDCRGLVNYEHPQMAITSTIIPQRSEEVGQSNVASPKNQN